MTHPWVRRALVAIAVSLMAIATKVVTAPPPRIDTTAHLPGQAVSFERKFAALWDASAISTRSAICRDVQLHTRWTLDQLRTKFFNNQVTDLALLQELHHRCP